MMTDELPTVSFTGHVKYMRFSALDEIQQAMLDFIFPGFRGEDNEELVSIENNVNPELGLESLVMISGNMRRYAPHQLFPRSRYYSVVRDIEREDDGGTLACELRAYRDPLRAGHVEIIDYSAPGQYRTCLMPTTDKGYGYYAQVGYEGHISVALFNEARFKSAFADKWDEIEEHSRTLGRHYQGLIFLHLGSGPFAILNLPYETSELTVDSTADLRLPQVRNWFYEIFSSHLHRFFVSASINSFWELLPFLLDSHIGGNPFTSFVGEKLIDLGVQALIYPSARTDFIAVIKNGGLHDFAGWNLVDLRPPYLEISENLQKAFDEKQLGSSILVSLDADLDIDTRRKLGFSTISNNNYREKEVDEDEKTICIIESKAPYAGSFRYVGLEKRSEKQYFHIFITGKSQWIKKSTTVIDKADREFAKSVMDDLDSIFENRYQLLGLNLPQRHSPKSDLDSDDNALKLDALETGKLDLEPVLEQLEKAAKLRLAQTLSTPPTDTPWCYFDLAEVHLYQGDKKGFLDYVNKGIESCNASWQPETFRQSLHKNLVDKNIVLDGLSEGIKLLDEAIESYDKT